MNQELPLRKKPFNFSAMAIPNILPLYDAIGGIVVTILSIVVGLGIIGVLIYFVVKSKKRKKMVHNRTKNNDNPEKMK